MDGLEAIELKLSEVLDDNDSKRIDSEYFRKEYLFFIKKLKLANYIKLNNDSNIKGGKRLPLGENFSSIGIPYIRAEDNKNMFVNFETSPKITDELHQRLKAYQTKFNDVLITNVGNSIGDVGIVKFKIDKCNLTENCIKIIDLKQNNPNYIFSFLNSKYGNLQIKRETVGTAQPKLAIERVRNFIIPILSNTFQLQIEHLVKLSYQKIEKSKILYEEAENLLLKELSLLDFEPTKENISIKSFSESFGSSERLDSEYYLPKYIKYIEILKDYKYGWKPIQEVLTNNIKSGTTPKEIIKKYIKNSNYFFRAEAFNNDLTLNYENLYSMSDEVFKEYPNITVKQNDVLVSMTGTIGSVAIVTKKIDGIINQNIVKLSANKEIINHNVLALYTKVVGKILLTREQTGNVQPYVNIPNFSNLIVPLIDKKIQTEIEDKIKESFRLKEESKKLLELAKKAVEVAIEDGEEKAMEYINE